MKSTTAKTALVTGATSGLGRSVARQLHERGWHVITGVRNAAQAQTLRAEGVCAASVQFDLGIEGTLRTIPAQLDALGHDGLDAVLHCAAVTGAAPLETVPMAEARQIFEVNVFGTIGLIQATAERLRRRRGRLLLTGSVGGFSIWPILGIYGATKHTMEGIADSARRELAPWGIQVALVRPGGIRTRMLDRHLDEMRTRCNALDGADAQHYGHLYRTYTERLTKTGKLAMTPDAMAAKLVGVIESRRMRPNYNFGLDCKTLRLIDLLLPDRAFDGMVAKLFPPA